MNLVLIVLDAVGYDVFKEAIAKDYWHGEVKKVHSPSCWTLPTFVSYLWSYPPLGMKRIFPWDPPKWAPLEFKRRGYKTAFFTGNPFCGQLFSDFLRKGFDVFEDFRKKNCITEMVDRSLQETVNKPFFHMLHIMETHLPYFDGRAEFPKIYEYSAQTLGNIDMKIARQHQIKSVQYVIRKLKRLFDFMPRQTKVILTSDHGEMFLPGAIGHAPNKVPFDIKLFEIPYVEWVIK